MRTCRLAIDFPSALDSGGCRKPPPGPLHQTLSHCFPAHCFPRFTAQDCAVLSGIERHCAGCGAPGASVRVLPAALGLSHDERRYLQFPSPSELVPPRRKQNESMQRKGNVLSCVDTRQRCLARKRDRRYDEWYPRSVPAASVKAVGIVDTGVSICLHIGIGGNGDVFG